MNAYLNEVKIFSPVKNISALPVTLTVGKVNSSSLLGLRRCLEMDYLFPRGSSSPKTSSEYWKEEIQVMFITCSLVT